MTILALNLAAVLLIIGVLHGLWGFRIWLPIGEEQQLARAVVGARDIVSMPPPLQCFLVAGALCGGALGLLMLIEFTTLPFVPLGLVQGGMGMFAVVFLMRGLVGFTPFWARITPEMPFRSLDRRVYSPLCLLLGAGILSVVVLGPM